MKKAMQLNTTWMNSNKMVKFRSCIGPKNFSIRLIRVRLLHSKYVSPSFSNST